MLTPRRIKDKALRRLYTDDDASGLNANWVPRLKRILAALNTICAPDEMNLPGYSFHQLKGDRKGTYALLVTRNWRVTFEWDSEGPLNVNLEDYHGR